MYLIPATTISKASAGPSSGVNASTILSTATFKMFGKAITIKPAITMQDTISLLGVPKKYFVYAFISPPRRIEFI